MFVLTLRQWKYCCCFVCLCSPPSSPSVLCWSEDLLQSQWSPAEIREQLLSHLNNSCEHLETALTMWTHSHCDTPLPPLWSPSLQPEGSGPPSWSSLKSETTECVGAASRISQENRIRMKLTVDERNHRDLQHGLQRSLQRNQLQTQDKVSLMLLTGSETKWRKTHTYCQRLQSRLVGEDFKPGTF